MGGGKLFDYQVITVDDGSTDATLAKLNELAKKYPRLLVLSQKNSGPGAAREFAISYAACDYLAFCDSDDWVEPDWLLSMYMLLKQSGADFLKCSCFIDKPGYNVISQPKKSSGQTSVLSQKSAIECFIEHKKLNGILWTNLFKRELFDNLHFNTNLVLFEDADIILKILLKCKSVAFCSIAKYHYVVSGDSLSNGKTSIKKIESTLTFWNGFLNTIASHYPDLTPQALSRRNNVLYATLYNMYRSSIYAPDLERQLLRVIRKEPLSIMRMQKSKLHKLIALIVCATPKIARFVLSKV